MESHATWLFTVNMDSTIWTLTVIHSFSLSLFCIHLFSSNFVLIHLIISSIILPHPSHLAAPHDCLFIYPLMPFSLTSPFSTYLITLLFLLIIYQPSPSFFCVSVCVFLFLHLIHLLLSFFLQLTILFLAFNFFHIVNFTPSRYLQFTLRLGSRSTLSSCPAPDQPGEGVLLHYSSDNGITWTLLQHYAYQGFHEPRYILCLACVCAHTCMLVIPWLHRDTKTALAHTFAPLMVCWRFKLLGPIESITVIYVCNEDKVDWSPTAQAQSQSSSSALGRSARCSESGTWSTQLSSAKEQVQVVTTSTCLLK